MDAQSAAPVPPPGCPGARPTIPAAVCRCTARSSRPIRRRTTSSCRHYGPTAPVELAPGVEATLVTDYSAAPQLLQDSSSFRQDARRQLDFDEGEIGPDSPVLPLLAYRPNCMFSDGAEYLRLRQAATDTMARVDSRRLARSTQQISGYLIAQFSARGSADVVSDYTKHLPLFVFNPGRFFAAHLAPRGEPANSLNGKDSSL
jgi:cytochrome P450